MPEKRNINKARIDKVLGRQILLKNFEAISFVFLSERFFKDRMTGYFLCNPTQKKYKHGRIF